MNKNKMAAQLSALLLSCVISSSVFAESRSWKFSENNNNVIAAQIKGGDPTKAGDVTIDFFGHMAFRITSPDGLTIMIDPWRNDPSGYWGVWFPKPFPEVPVDLVLSTHAHFDHDAVYRPHATQVLERLSGEYKLGDVKVTGLADKHMCAAKGWYKWTDAGAEFGQDFCAKENAMHMDNYIQVIETGGVKIAHWGDNRPVPAAHVEEVLKTVDVLIMNIDDSQHILSYEDVDSALTKYKPKMVIPGHYYTKGASSVLTTLSTADKWVDAQQNVTKLKTSRVVVNPAKLKEMDRNIYYFGMNHTKE
ncbi:MAG: L-ascorbate metabolism protein UlaG (beta-lactamase superfamily) [Oceanospirillaceae bacterium]|jgi:L-ascorbate metabolism protein UlaG (beta-lactamase superfamily)